MRYSAYISGIFGMLLLNLSLFAQIYGGGDGSPEHPFEIWNETQMNTIGLYRGH